MVRDVRTLADRARGGRLTGWALGSDTPRDLALVLALFSTYLLLDRLIQALVVIEQDDLDRPVLLLAAFSNRWWLILPIIIVAIGLVAGWRQRVLIRWDAVEHGSVLRLLALPLILFLMWKGSLYPYNFVADQAHAIDRLLVVALGLLALSRPILLLPFLFHFRIVNEQTLFPFGTSAPKNTDEFLVVSLLGIAAAYLLAAVVPRIKTSGAVLLLQTVVAAHFYIPGKGKLAIDWATATDLANLPLGSHTAGWLGNTEGGWARGLSGGFETFGPAIIVSTLVLELGALVVVASPRLLRWWLVGWVAFHGFTFATTGFFFLPWIALEVALLILLFRPRFRDWVTENATPARGAIAVLAVFGAPVLFHPPGLAWLDAPISYGYEMEAVGESGVAYHVPAAAFAPLDHELTFSRLQLGPTVPLSGGYGSVVNEADMDRLSTAATFDDVARLEASQPETTLVEESQDFLLAFFDRSNEQRRFGWLYRLGPPSYYWTQADSPDFAFDEPLVALDVYHVTSLHNDRSPLTRRELVLRIEQGTEGEGQVVAAVVASSG